MYLPGSSHDTATAPTALVRRALYSAPPPAQDAVTNNPTLLVSWWCTCFALAIIMARLAGRWIRTERLFVEDRIMAVSILPLLGRMACAHFVIRWGTNNVVFEGLSAEEIRRREIGSQLLTIAEFLRRLYSSMWKRSWEVTTQGIRWFLAVTFVAVVVATLTECRPFPHYWQVSPDPGPHCRQGFVQLITMGVSDTITDLVLVAFPIPVILASSMPWRRKLSLCALFGLSLSLVAITIYRVTATIDRRAEQQFRSLVASFEILAATAVANALVLGSFVRDRGAKKAKYKRRPDDAAAAAAAKAGSIAGPGGREDGSLDRPSTAKAHKLQALSWGSDSDLAGGLGFRLVPQLKSERQPVARPAPIALPSDLKRADASCTIQASGTANGVDIQQEDGVSPLEPVRSPKDLEAVAGSAVSPLQAPLPAPNDGVTPRKMSFFDVGGLLDTSPSPKPEAALRSDRRASAADVGVQPDMTEASDASAPARALSAGSTPQKEPVPAALPGFADEERSVPVAKEEERSLQAVPKSQPRDLD